MSLVTLVIAGLKNLKNDDVKTLSFSLDSVQELAVVFFSKFSLFEVTLPFRFVLRLCVRPFCVKLSCTMNVDHHWRLVLQYVDWAAVHSLHQCSRRFHLLSELLPQSPSPGTVAERSLL